jgi:hypothetical protein
MNLKEAVAEIMHCRHVDPARAAILEAQVLGRGSRVAVDPNDNPDLKAARVMLGLAASKT